MLVQQIQLAVQAGYLNHQILNQPLAPTTLVLLNQLLTNIKVSDNSSNLPSPEFIAKILNDAFNVCDPQQLQVAQANMNRGINHLHMTMNATKLKQQISNLQSQIAQQQAAYVNKQPGGGHTVSD